MQHTDNWEKWEAEERYKEGDVWNKCELFVTLKIYKWININNYNPWWKNHEDSEIYKKSYEEQ